eukprot:TRINITY_DN6452_c0_g1_i1.p1 TRINITY_DN6452_c0_g1~~TRINITY_DN6452_c0_g1_i1.p1  ORF type:complete len:141 (+),score=16.59 TRINITY_DN6452_c0_g1_i1:111-533(+)
MEPTPSLISKDIAYKFRMSLLALLVLDVLYYFFGSFATGGDLSAVDMILLFLGYYAQDIYRASPLNLYFILSIVSLVIDIAVELDTAVFLMRESVHFTWLVAVLSVVFIIESGFKVASIYFARKLYLHLIAVPGQSVEQA